jgi:hypothetical protein
MQKNFERLTVDIYKQRFGGIVKLCSSLKSTDYWTFRGKEEDDLLDTVHDFSSAMYDNFHHLAPEIIGAFGSLCENEDIGFTLYSALCSKNVSLRSYLPSHTRSNRLNGLSIQSRFARRFRHLQRFRESTLYSG